MFPGNRSDQQLKLLGVHVDESAAIGAVEMVVMGLEGAGELVALLPAKWYELDNVQADKELQGSVNTNTVYSRTGGYNIADHQGLVCGAERVKYCSSWRGEP